MCSLEDRNATLIIRNMVRGWAGGAEPGPERERYVAWLVQLDAELHENDAAAKRR